MKLVAVCVPQCVMPRSKGLSSRPRKKARLEPTETKGSESADVDCNEDGQLDVFAHEEEPLGEGPRLGSPGAVKREAASQVHSEAIERAAVMRTVEKTFLEQAAHAKRVCDARERRLDDVQKPNRQRSLQTTWNRVCRRLENIVEQQEAQLNAAWTSTKAERAMAEVHAAHVCVLELEIARLKRELRRTKK